MKKIIFFVLLLSLVSRGSYSQTKTLQSFPKVTPALTDSVFGTHLGANKNFSISDILDLEAARVKAYSGKTFSGLTSTFTNIPESAVSNLIADLTTLTNGIATANTNISSNTTAISGKQATLVSGTNIKTINSVSLLGSGNIVISGGGGTTIHPYVDVAYSSTMNLDFSATNYANITGVNSDLTFTSSNSSNGYTFGVVLNITTNSAVNIYFTQANFGTPGLLSQTALAKPAQTSTPYSYTILAGSSGAKILLVFDYIASNQFVTAINLQNSDYPSSIRANNLNLRNFPAFADPGNTTTETVVYSHKISANTLNDSSTLVIPYVYRRTSGSGVIQFKIRACPTASATLSSCPTIEDFGQNSGFGDYRRTCILQNVNHSSNLTQLGYAENFGNFSTATSKSVDWSQDVYLKFSIEKQTSGTQVGGVGMIRINGEGL